MVINKQACKKWLSIVLSSLGIGCSIGWYLFFHDWVNSIASIDTLVPLFGRIDTALLSLVTVATLGFLAFFRTRLESEGARIAVLSVGFALFIAAIIVSWGVSYAWLPVEGAVLALTVFSKVLYGLVLCAWMQSLVERTVRMVMISASLALLFGGCFSILFLADLVRPPLVSSLLLLLPFSTFLVARLVGQGVSYGESARAAVVEFRNVRISVVAMYAVLMGFATTQFYVYNASAESVGLNVVSLVAAGVLLVFIALYMSRMIDIIGCFFLSAVLFVVIVLFWIALPEMGVLVAATTGSIHWASFALLAAAACMWEGKSTPHPVALLCGLMALFRVASLLSTVALVIEAGSHTVMSIASLLLLVVTLALAYRQRRTASLPVAEEGGSNTRVLDSLADEYKLTPRESEVFRLLSEGNSLKHIAEVLFLSENTVKRHRANVYRKLGVGSRQELIDLTRTMP